MIWTSELIHNADQFFKGDHAENAESNNQKLLFGWLQLGALARHSVKLLVDAAHCSSLLKRTTMLRHAIAFIQHREFSIGSSAC